MGRKARKKEAREVLKEKTGERRGIRRKTDEKEVERTRSDEKFGKIKEGKCMM